MNFLSFTAGLYIGFIIGCFVWGIVMVVTGRDDEN